MRSKSNVNIPQARGENQTSPDPPGDWKAYAGRVIRHQATRLVRQAGLPATDRADVEQELWLDLLKRWSRFDADRAGRRTFTTRVVRHQALKIRGRHKESAADPTKTVGSLHQLVAGEDGRLLPLVQTVDEESQALRIGHHPRAPQELFELKSDVRQSVARLPAELRDLCGRLMRLSVSQVARELGITRTSLYRRLAKVRLHLSREGLQEYL